MDTLRTAIRTDVDEISPREQKLVKLWADRVGATVWRLWVDQEQGIMLKGKRDGYDFSANLKLAIIKEFCPWTNSEYAALTDYPEMASCGDWSGVRDTENIIPLWVKVLNDLLNAGLI